MTQTNSKIFALPQLIKKLDLMRKGRSVVFTNGCFDLLHIGHIRLLKKAKELGDILVVALNTDASVRKLKGVTRPIVPLKERMEILSALESVDFVSYFHEETPEKTLKLLRPDILVKGADYRMSQVVGAKFIKSYGGKIVILPFYKGKSSTNILTKIKSH